MRNIKGLITCISRGRMREMFVYYLWLSVFSDETKRNKEKRNDIP